MGIPSHDNMSAEKRDRLERNRERFEALPPADKQVLLAGLEKAQTNLKRTFFDKLTRSVHIVAFEIPPFEQAWLLLSFIIPILLLKKVSGAAQAVWLLPLLAGLYALDNRLYGLPSSSFGEAHLYPTEQVLVEYLKEPLEANIFQQREQLLRGWQLYLINQWTGATPSTDPAVFGQQAETGEFAFNVMRLQRVASTSPPSHRPYLQEPLWLLALYFFWNCYFAYTAWNRVYLI